MRLAVIPIVLLAFAFTACGEKTVDADSAEETVAGLISEQTGFEPTDMSCPSDVEAKQGDTFECSFTGPEGPYTASVRITEVDGDDATFFVRSRPSG